MFGPDEVDLHVLKSGLFEEFPVLLGFREVVLLELAGGFGGAAEGGGEAAAGGEAGEELAGGGGWGVDPVEEGVGEEGVEGLGGLEGEEVGFEEAAVGVGEAGLFEDGGEDVDAGGVGAEGGEAGGGGAHAAAGVEDAFARLGVEAGDQEVEGLQTRDGTA